VLLAALVSGLFLTCYAQNSAVNFTTAQPIPLLQLTNSGVPSNQQPPKPACTSLFAGKFHHSSKMDFLATCLAEGDANPITSALLNQGNGTYELVDDSASDSAGDIAVLSVDLNGDGYSDLVINQIFSSTIGVQLSNGDGTFKAPVYYTAPSAYFIAAVAGDFEDNGRMDIAVLTSTASANAGGGASTLTIFLNDGAGKLAQSASYTLNTTPSGDYAPILVAGDLNGDHKTDLAVVYRTATGTVTPYISQGNGKFTKGGSYSVGPSPVSAAIGNFTSDAYGDIAVANATGVTVLLGDSRATFTTLKSTPYPSPMAGFNPGDYLVLGDFDKDGNLDVAFTTSFHNNSVFISHTDMVIVFWGAGNGSFSSYSAYSIPLDPALPPSASFPPVALVSADINDSGNQDLAVAAEDGSVDLLFNLGSRNFRAAPNTHSPYSAGIVAADFNGDGKKGIAVVNTPPCKAPCDGTVTVFPGEGTYFGAGKTYSIGMHGSAIAVGDINGDGVLDLVVTNATAGDSADTSILLGIKGGGFEPAHNITLGALSNDAFLVDVNDDGKLDLVEDGGVALGDGKGDFGSLIPFPNGIAFSQPEPYVFNTHIGVGDFNGDGLPDVVAVFTPSGGSQQADVLFNKGKGDFTATALNDFDQLAGDGVQVQGVTVGSLHGGGIKDIVVTGPGSGGSGDGALANAFVFLNDGKGNFTLANGIAISVPGQLYQNIGAVTIADFNHDGYPDIGFSSSNEFFVSTGPDFNSPGLIFAESSGSTTNPDGNLAVADFNGDGWPDVVFTNSYGISRLYNVPVPTVSPASLTWTAAGTKTVTIKNTTKTAQSIEVGLFFTGTAPPGGASPFKITSNTCPSSLAEGASCTVRVENSGSTLASGTLFISANGGYIDAVALSVN
jgi:hypothetical protein